MNGCTLSTIENGNRTTGLYPFDENWPENNKEKFCMAETLDRDKLDAKLSAHNADLSFADSYKMFETRAAKIETHFEQAGENLQATFPDLHAAVKEYLDTKKKQGQMLEKAANVLRVPDNTKVRKIGPPRLNTLNEPFGAPKVLNSQDRIAKLEELKKVADAHNQQRLDKIAQNKQKCAAKKAQADTCVHTHKALCSQV